MKNQEKMQNNIKSIKEEVAILSYDQDCVYSVILESAQDLLEKIIYPTFDQFKETAKSFMEKSDINFFSSLGHRWEPFYHKKIRVDLTKKLRALQSTLCARVKMSIFEVCKVPPISIVAEASKISAWKKNPAISNSFRKLFDKVEEDEEDTYMTQIIKNVISIAEIILNPNNENIKISEKIIKPVLLKNLNKIENNKSFEYESDSPERLEVTPKRLAASKKSAVSERPAALRKGDKAYEANEAYEADEGDKYYNEIINIDESEEE
ncbi:hypothetical protein Glove_18g90 [Diversispora epigaea]|uniref:Uncharacterized protein n=1 Tax=Diversispora epigaea TaxID=1348612 RepID=A0A397JLG8_9GLOM|nr:hypothetical protein Glove_18g90 [Diversispora epigaea]